MSGSPSEICMCLDQCVQNFSVLSRHTPLFQTFLLKGEPHSCVPCNVSFSLAQVLLYCSDLSDAREKFEANSLKILFRHFSRKLMGFFTLLLFSLIYEVVSVYVLP